MAQYSTIEWTDHTFNPWWGCVKVSPGCEHCYAETWANRYGHKVWGPAKTTPRRLMSADYWKQPIKWNKAAQVAGTRARVFCASMADVFEAHPQLVEPRARMFDLIGETPNLDWLLLTKRPENVKPMLINIAHPPALPANVWMGTSVENQEQANKRIPELLKISARVRFLSCEPLLGPVDLSGRTADSVWIDQEYADADPELGRVAEEDGWPIHWVICGGESGPGARPMHPEWAQSLRDQCNAAGVAFFFKQHGEYLPMSQMIPGVHCSEGEQIDAPDNRFLKLGKHAAGRMLDGREWNEVPA